MTIPSESEWQRAEEIVAALKTLTPDEAAHRLAALKAQGEPASILSLVVGYLELPPPKSPLAPGSLLRGEYRLEQMLGVGGMGAVWLATQESLKRKVAIKIIQPYLVSPALCERFARERFLLARLKHRGIVTIFEAGVHEDSGESHPYFSMEYVEGVTLGKWAEQHRGNSRELARVFAEICAAVQHAHDQRIVHRDLKPSNIMVRPDGHAVVLDFGVARLAGGAPDDADGGFSGTPHYAAPEQHLGRDGDFRSGESVDVYAAGAILFEMFAGRRLFQFPSNATLSEIRRAILEDTPPRLRDVCPSAPALIEEIAARAVRRDPADRYYTISGLSRALQAAIDSLELPGQPAPPSWTPAVGALVPGTQWRLTTPLGEGSTGQVWAAEQEGLTERRVFKFCDTEEKTRSLKREHTLFRLLKDRVGLHPHFIPLHDVSLDDPPWYLMMDHVDARDLEAWCAAQPGGLAALSEETRLELIAQTAEALQAAHEAGILHRDIKPSNLLVGLPPADPPCEADSPSPPRPQPLHVYIADFGIGQIVADEYSRGGTRRGFTATISQQQRHTFSGTLRYMAPEVAKGHSATARSDIYSLGIILWQLLISDLDAVIDSEWPERIADPLLRADLHLCLASDPSKRWASAGEFAASIRALPARRSAEAHRQDELAARDKAAYRRGILRTSAVASAILAIVVALAIVAWHQRRDALRSRSAGALEQAAGIPLLDFRAGRRERGLTLLDKAAEYPADLQLLRSTSIAIMALPDLVPVALPARHSRAEPALPPHATAIATSPNGALVAVGQAVDKLSGLVELRDPAGKLLSKLDRGPAFPWVPVPEPGFLLFSPDNSTLAVAGPATSAQVLLGRTSDGHLESYLFHGEGLTCMAWHPENRLLVTGRDDRLLRIWDRLAARSAKGSNPGNSNFALPPALDVPAIDFPSATLRGHRDRLVSIAFAPSGEWMGSLDAAGWLCIWRSQGPDFLPNLPPAEAPKDTQAPQPEVLLPLQPSLEMKVELPETTSLTTVQNQLVLSGPAGPLAAYEFSRSTVFHECYVAPNLTDIAWSADATSLCAITSTDIFWLGPASLRPTDSLSKKHAVAVAWDASSGAWALPAAEEFIERKPLSATNAGSASERWKPTPARKDQAGQLAMAASASGRLALYYARRLQFATKAKPENPSTSVVVGSEGEFQGILWDRGGRLLTTLHHSEGKLRVQSWQTSSTATLPHGTVDLPTQRLISAEDGTRLLGRIVAQGLQWIDPLTGHTQLLDGSIAARQDSPFAISPDGKWIAMVVDRTSLRLLRQDGTVYATFTAPRAADISQLAWHPRGDGLAVITADGYVQIWSLAPWREWLEKYGLQK